MRESIKNLEIGEGKVKLSDEEIKMILTEHGKTVSTEVEKAKAEKDKEIETYKTTISNLENQIKEMPNSEEVDKLKKEINDMKEAETKRIADEKAANEKRIREERTNEFFKDIKFTSESAKAGVISKFNEKDFKYDEETKKYQGASEWLEEIQKNDAGAFASNVANPKFTTGVTTPTNPGTADALRRAMGLPEEDKK